jgi:hypothetical protein
MPLRRPAIDPATLPARTGSGYPEPFRSRVVPREKRAIGDAFGLTKIGVNLTTLLPGKESSMRHFHTHEDELVLVIPERCFGVAIQDTEIRLSREHTHYRWVSYEEALRRLHWDSNRNALWELDLRLRRGQA